MRSANIETTEAIFTAFGAGDIEAILPHLDEKIVIEFYGPPTIPYAGTYHGREAARCFFETVLSSIEVVTFEPEEMLEAGADKVVVTGRLHLVARATGRPIESDFVHVITLADGRWTRFRDFMNTAAAVAAFSD